MSGRDPRKPGWFQYALAKRDSDVLIGDIGINLHVNLMQEGFTVARGWQRCGYAFEAVNRLLDQLFADPGMHKVSAECDARTSRRCACCDGRAPA